MSDDYNELVIDLREYLTTRQISDLLEAQAKEIAELKDQLRLISNDCWIATARIAKLKAALKMAADDLDAAAKFTNFNVYHIAANQARAALKGEKG